MFATMDHLTPYICQYVEQPQLFKQWTNVTLKFLNAGTILIASFLIYISKL
jgi:hypothetical protein